MGFSGAGAIIKELRLRLESARLQRTSLNMHKTRGFICQYVGVGVCKAAKDIIQHAQHFMISFVSMGGYLGWASLGRQLTDQRAVVAIGVCKAVKDISEHAQHVVYSILANACVIYNVLAHADSATCAIYCILAHADAEHADSAKKCRTCRTCVELVVELVVKYVELVELVDN